MKALKELFDNQERWSEQLVEELAAYEATHAQMEAEFNAADEICIPLAARWNNERAAGSPRALATEIELRKARWTRDGIRAKWNRERDRIMRELDALTREIIREFHFKALGWAEQIPKMYKFERVEKKHNFLDDKRPYSVVVKHNSAALDRLKTWVFAQIQAVHALNHSPLRELKKKIAACEQEFHTMDVNSLEVDEVTENMADMMKPRSAAVELYHDQVADMSSRIKALEGRR